MSETEQILAELRKINARLDGIDTWRKQSQRPSPGLLTYAQAAAELSLGAGLTKLRQMIRNGELRTVQVGKRQRIPRAEIERLTALRVLPTPTKRHVGALSAKAEAEKLRALLRGGR